MGNPIAPRPVKFNKSLPFLPSLVLSSKQSCYFFLPVQFLEGLAPAEMQSLLFCKVLAKKPGWKDSNFQVMNAKFEIVATLASKAAIFGKKSTACVLPALVEKLGDIKVW